MIAIFPATLACAAKGDIEELVVIIRRYYGGEETFAPCPDVKGIAARVGFCVEKLPFDGVGALVAKDERGVFAITAIVAPHVDQVAERFLLAHMLGHYFLDIQPLIARGEWQRSGFRENACPLRRYSQGDLTKEPPSYDLAKEMRADLFASSLLMPLGMVRRAIAALHDKDKVARFFGVTRPCLDRRLIDIGVESEGPVNFLDAEASLVGEQPQRPGCDENAPLNPPLEPAMPRSFAASSYGQTARSTARPPGGEKAPEGAAASRPVSGGANRRVGMQRLREIAHKLDKFSGPKE